ncbi:MAG: hypothetical protein JWO82_3783 [Akkermansiaceae bacterium]|nr:hypothetical protein [Akkermansiaceae bacterium]
MNPPSPDSPAPAAPRSRFRFRFRLLPVMVAGVVIVGFCLSVWPQIAKQKKAADQVRAISNLKAIGLALQEFQSEYGRYPDESTAITVKAATKTNLDLSGTSSNRLFRQFLVTGLKSEKIFYAPQPGHRWGDDRFDDDAHALEPGEVGFGYLTGEADSNAWTPTAILAVAPLVHGTPRFNPEPYRNLAPVLLKDNSVGVRSVGADGLSMRPQDPQNIFDASAPYWGGHAPVIHWAEEPVLPH